MLPYTAEVLFNLMGRYNAAMGAGVAVAIALALVAVGLAVRPRAGGDRVITGILALGWLWTGAVFHNDYFAPLNFAAPIYAGLFVLQSALLLLTGVGLKKLRFRAAADTPGIIGLVIIGFALLGNPVLGWLAGWPLAQTQVVGLAPNPTAMLTLGLLLLVRPTIPLHLLVLPVLWALWIGWMSWVLGITSDLTLPVAGVIALAVAIVARIRGTRRTRRDPVTPPSDGEARP
jgi:hypothetical protein